MSVINRMLTDLERRGAPGARHRHAADGPAGPESPRRLRRWLQRLGPPALLIALVVVAAALWREQWPHLLTLVEDGRERVAIEEVAGDDTASGAENMPGVRRFAFEREGATTRIVVAFDRPLAQAPGYGRSGDRIELQLPARWKGTQLAAPPEGQSVYRSAVVDERGDEGARIAMRVDPDARFDLDIDGARLALSGRVPETAERADSTGAAAVDGDAAVATLAGGEAGGGAATADTPASDANATDTKQTATDQNGTGGADGQSEQAEKAGQRDRDRDTGDDADAGGGQDSARPDDAADNGDADDTDTAPAGGRDEDRPAETGSDDAEGEVRKSEPDVPPEERARRLEAKAREALEEGDVRTARERLLNALEFDADRHAARDLLVRLALRSGDDGAARNLLAEGVARAPERPAFAKPFARLLVDSGETERALRVLRRAAPAADGDAGYHGLTAAVAQRLKRHDLAAAEYTRALEIDGSRGVWWMGLGISLRATDHPDEALAAFREARASGDLNERLDRWVQQRIDALSRTGE